MAQYVPGEVPTTQDIQQLERWLRMEFEQVRNSTDDIYEVATVTAKVTSMVADKTPAWKQTLRDLADKLRSIGFRR